VLIVNSYVRKWGIFQKPRLDAKQAEPDYGMAEFKNKKQLL
jgi:hypothetical protein